MNLTSARQEPQDRLAQLDKLSAAVHDVCDSLCFPLGAPRITYSTSGIVEHLTDLSRGLLDAAILVEADQACMEKAQARVLANIPPTVKGNQFKDAAILEHYLAICSQLHSIGFGPKVVFCTSNTNDYFEGKSHLHPVLATEFAAISLAYRPNLRAAVAEVLG
ncbi:MAG: hypothetical protein MUF18_04260 [Fimbriiglobus sp.]|nr:hypothetical protein [Fimbriiglobus sp.]